MIPIRSIMKRGFSKLSSSESVGAAAKVMEKNDVDYSVVEEEGEIRGIVTSRQLVGYPLSRLLLDCAIQPVTTITEEALAKEALRVLEEEKASFLVVLNAEGTPAGVTNRQTIIDSLFQELEKLNGEKDKYIAELRRAEEALRLSKESFHNIVNRNVDGVLIIDRKGIVHFVNPAAEALFGRKANKLLGEMFGLPVVVGDVSEIDTIHASGKLGVAEMRVIETEWEGESACLASVRDITERKRAEEMLQESQARLAKAQRIAHLGNGEWDIVKNKLVWSDEACRILGLSLRDFGATFEAFLSSVHPDDREYVEKAINEALHENKPYDIEHRIVRPDGSERFVREQGEITFGESGKPLRMIGTIQDITERKQMQSQLMMTDRLVSIGELASGVAHEINNPLTGVIGFSQLLLEKDIPDDIEEDVRIISNEAQRAAAVVKNLLTFARKHEPEKQLVNMNSVIEKTLELRAYEQKVSNIEVITQFAPDLPGVMADYFQLQQVFINIIINAEYFMVETNGRGTLTITTEKVGDIIRTSFADDGPGIRGDKLGHLFDPFFTTKEVGKGTGLGLSICHGIIAEHSGRIYAKSKGGKGATFIVELPTNNV